MKLFSVRILILLLIITGINNLDRNAISYALLPIQRDLHLNSAQFGLIAASWGIGYMGMVFFGGALIDRFGSIKTWTLFAFLWSLTMAMMSLASGLFIFCFLRFLLGIFEAVHYPALAKTVADWMPHPWRSRCMALGLVGVPVSSLLGAPILTYLIESSGWRNMFLLMGSLGILWSIFWFFNFKGKVNPQMSSSERGVPTHKHPFFALITTPCILVNCVIYFIFAYILFFGLFWLPGYFEKTHEVSISNTGFLVILPWSVGAFFLLSAGWTSDFLWKKTHSLRISRSLMMAAGMLLSSLCFFLLARLQGTEHDLIFISLGLGFAFIANPIVNTLAVDLFPHSPGLSQALHSFFFALAGVVSPSLTGILVHQTGGFTASIDCISGIALFAGLLALFFHRPDRCKVPS